jgi:hypothetical protein
LKDKNYIEVRSDDNRLICKAKLIEGDILLILRTAGHLVEIPYTEIPRLVFRGHKLLLSGQK